MVLIRTSYLTINEVTHAEVQHIIENTSDHDPICAFLKIVAPAEASIIKSESFQPQKTKYLWSEASPEDKANYSASLDELLAKFNIPSGAICCCDLKCRSEQCRREAVKYSDAICGAILEAAKLNIAV